MQVAAAAEEIQERPAPAEDRVAPAVAAREAIKTTRLQVVPQTRAAVVVAVAVTADRVVLAAPAS